MELSARDHCNWCGIVFRDDRFLNMHFEPPGCPVRNRSDALEARRPRLEGDWRDVRRRIPFAQNLEAERLLPTADGDAPATTAADAEVPQ